MSGQYYYAAGRRVRIAVEARMVAIDRERARRAGLRPRARSKAGTRGLPGELLLLERETLAPSLAASLERAGALRTVYRRGETLLVPLPEIRVEWETAPAGADLRRLLERLPHAVEVIRLADACLQLDVRSGRGEDALEVANHLYEDAGIAGVSVRLVQVTPTPEPRPSPTRPSAPARRTSARR